MTRHFLYDLMVYVHRKCDPRP